MEIYHTGILPSFVTTIIFMMPMFYFYHIHHRIAMLLYPGVMLYILVLAFSNKRFASELDMQAWKDIRLDFAKIFKLQQKLKDL